jgi:probable phosphoglycerate mutase
VTDLYLLRHGPTAWNGEDRIQGRSDVPLSPEGRALLRRFRLPEMIAGARLVSSPLIRARETARLLTGREPLIEQTLIEAQWGAWEGLTRAATHGLALRQAARGQSGVTWRPPGGESLGEVQARLLAWTLSLEGGPVLAVTHKGIIRAALALGTGWDMVSKAPVRLAWRALHHFRVEGGRLHLAEANIGLLP